ncbi:MAG: hypothetical protein ABL973_06640 [Micropepsaceae bacterium]
MPKPTILAIGFDVFPGAPENPTAWAIRELQRENWQPVHARLVTDILPVRYNAWDDVALPLLQREKPDAVLAFGLSAKTTGFTLESTARNVIAVDRPDFTGACSTADCVDEKGPRIYPTSLPFSDIIAALQQAKLPFVRSDDAGNYLCNMLFYNLMHLAEALNLKMAGFIHAPYLTTQIERLASAGHTIKHGGTLSEQDFLKGTKLIIETCARKLAG